MLEDAERKGIKMTKDVSGLESQLQDTQVTYMIMNPHVETNEYLLLN